jgi:hypothetical protein
MPIISLRGTSFSGITRTFELLLSKHIQNGTFHATPFTGIYQRPACGLAMNLQTTVF